MAAFAQKALQKIDVAAGTSGIRKEENCLDQFCRWKKKFAYCPKVIKSGIRGFGFSEDCVCLKFYRRKCLWGPSLQSTPCQKASIVILKEFDVLPSSLLAIIDPEEGKLSCTGWMLESLSTDYIGTDQIFEL
ncbi:uncharacterized protein ACIQIH_004645 [Cyanocitta cristata]